MPLGARWLYNGRSSFALGPPALVPSVKDLDPKLLQALAALADPTIAKRLAELTGSGGNYETVRELWPRYEAWYVLNVPSWDSTKKHHAKHILKFFGDKPAMSVTASFVTEYRSMRQKAGTQPSTRNNEVSTFKAFYNWCCSDDGDHCLPHNPIHRIRKEKTKNIRRNFLVEETVQRIREDAPFPLCDMMLVAFDTGMRNSEVRELRLDQVDWARGVIQLGQEDQKNCGVDEVPLTARALEALRRAPRHFKSRYVWYNERARYWRADLRAKWDFEEGLPPMSKSTISEQFRTVCDRLGLKGIGGEDYWFHDTRKGWAVGARRAGASWPDVKKGGRWKSDSAAHRYQLFDDDDTERIRSFTEKRIADDEARIAAKRADRPLQGHTLSAKS